VSTPTETLRLAALETARIEYGAAVIAYVLAKRVGDWAGADVAASRAHAIAEDAYRLVDQSSSWGRSDEEAHENRWREFRDLETTLEKARAWAHNAAETL
jgi:hypothetical protein